MTSPKIERYIHTMKRSLRNVDVTDNSLRLAAPVTKTFIGTFAFRSAVPGIWNKLLDDT